VIETAGARETTPRNGNHAGWLLVRPEIILVATVWVALLTGLFDAGVIGIRKFLLGELVHRSPHVVWMAPAAYVALFALPGLCLYAFARLAPRRCRPGLAFGLLMLAATTSALLMLFHQRLHPVALVLLAIGLAAQLGKWAGAHVSGFSRFVRRTTPMLVLLVILLGTGIGGSQWWAERSEIRALPAARTGAPNVVFIILDTVRAASMSLYGYGRPNTPRLEEWARAGVVFERAVAPSSWTLPSHASMFTGLAPHALSTHWLRPLDDRQPTLAEVFRANGYRTAGFVANLQYATAEMGLGRGFSRYEDYQISPGQILMNSALGRFLTTRRSLRTLVGTDEIVGRKKAADVGRDFLAWADGLKDRPFFAFLNYYDAHDPYLPPDSFYQTFAGTQRANRLSPLRRIGVRARRNGLSPADQRQEVVSYDASIAYLDFELDRLFKQLDQRGLLRNTLLVVTSDHGEEFGEHGLYLHGNDLYMTSLHVPLVIRLPGTVPAGVTVAQPVSLTDLAVTIADIAGVHGARLGGQSLAPLWRGGNRIEGPVRSELQKGIRLPEWYPVAAGDMTSLVWEGKQYIRSAPDREELFDWSADPLALRNVLQQYQHSDLLTYLRGVASQPTRRGPQEN